MDKLGNMCSYAGNVPLLGKPFQFLGGWFKLNGSLNKMENGWRKNVKIATNMVDMVNTWGVSSTKNFENGIVKLSKNTINLSNMTDKVSIAFGGDVVDIVVVGIINTLVADSANK